MKLKCCMVLRDKCLKVASDYDEQKSTEAMELMNSGMLVLFGVIFIFLLILSNYSA